MVVVINNLDEFKAALKDAGNKLVVVDFTATWCGPCQMIAPIFKSLSEKPEYANVVFLKVDVDEADDVSSHCEINCMPTFQFYKNEKRVHTFSGAREEDLKESLNKFK